MIEAICGINKVCAHERAIELIPEDFFWNPLDELAPFGSDEGDIALLEFRVWKREYPMSPVYECLTWIIESVGQMKVTEYNDSILDRGLLRAQVEDVQFDDQQFIYTLDTTLIATGFGQLVDEGVIDEVNKPIIQRALERQQIWAEQFEFWDYKDEYISRLNTLKRLLKIA